MAITTCDSASNHYFLHHESLFQSVRQVCAFSCISFVSYHLSSAGEEKEVGRGASHSRQRGEPKEGSILIKGLGAEPWLKIETEGRLASISAGADGPIDSSTAASGC